MRHISPDVYIELLECNKNFRLQVYDDGTLTNNEKYVVLTESTIAPFLGSNYQDVMVSNHITALKDYVKELCK